ncbi:MAG TPA: type I polyketide synthase [Pyrinomonadaceae bacterium]|nr:type I polyketide synthase [Pyrinomonadaceae bacterium]
MNDSFNGTEIAVIGMAGRYPRSRNLDEFWDHLRDGDELISFFTDEELLARGVDPAVVASPQFVKAAVVLDDMDQFDASFFGFTRREAELLDPQHRLFLETAWEALENAGYSSDSYAGLIGVYAGAGVNSYFLTNLFNNPNFGPLEQLSLLLASDKDYMMTRASYKLNLRGPSVMVQSACSTSLIAIHLACQGLLLEECDIALAGASNVHTILRDGYYTVEGGVYSPDGHCRAFDADGKGTLFGSGVGIVVLKRLADALADGDHIEAVVKGSAVNNDGSMKVSYTAPSVEGQARVIAEALANAGVSAETISYIEAHGTATNLGDPIEIQALTKAFRATTDKKGFCAVGSVKSNLGHLDSAAGVTGIIKTVLSLTHKSIPPSLHFKRPNPAIDFENTPFYVNNKLSEWSSASPRRAGVSSFGIGGTNAHIVLEEAPPPVPASESRPWQLLVLSAKTESALETATHNLTKHFKGHPDLNLADTAYTLSTGRKAFKHRKTLVCKDLSDAIGALENNRRVMVGHQPKPRLVAFMFPGQGSQRLNMAQQIYAHESTFREQVDLCSRLLEPDLGVDLRQVVYAGNSPEAAEKLKQTSLAQAALFVIEYALAQLWQEWGIKPWAMVGHSIGEYVAACLAGVFTLEDALKLVAMRGRLMQEAPAGAMLAVPVAAENVRPLMSANLSLAAINAPQRCVVSGPEEAIAALQRRLEKQELPCQRLHTSHAFHSEMMEPVLEPFRRFLRKIELREPKIPYISNVTGDWITAEQATSPDNWADHLRRTVRFADGVVQLLKEPDCVLLEVGPGQTLTNLARQSVNGNTQEVIIASGDKLEDDLLSLINAAAKLWLAGAELDWSGFYAHERRQRLALPTYPFERKRYWIERPVAAAAEQRLERQVSEYAPHVPDSAFEIVATQLHVMDLQLKAFRENA